MSEITLTQVVQGKKLVGTGKNFCIIDLGWWSQTDEGLEVNIDVSRSQF